MTRIHRCRPTAISLLRRRFVPHLRRFSRFAGTSAGRVSQRERERERERGEEENGGEFSVNFEIHERQPLKCENATAASSFRLESRFRLADSKEKDLEKRSSRRCPTRRQVISLLGVRFRDFSRRARRDANSRRRRSNSGSSRSRFIDGLIKGREITLTRGEVRSDGRIIGN